MRDGISPKTLKNYAECLSTFCCWAKKRGYLDRNPLEDLATFEGAPESLKRALTPEEFGKVLAVAPEHRRLLYEVAMMTGLRAGELRSLSPASVDLNKSVLILSADWTKNRKPGLQPIPGDLAQRLVEYGKNGVARELYDKHYGRSDAKMADIPDNPLLFISTHPSRELDKDLKAAGIPKEIPGEGKVDFHSLRVCFVTMIINAGANAKEAQELARHSNPNLTMNTYAKARTDHMAELVNQVSSTVQEHSERALCVHIEEIEGDSQPAIPLSVNNLDGVLGWWRRRDSKPLCCHILHDAELLQNTNTNGTNLCNNRHLQEERISQKNKTLTLPEHIYDTSLQKKCAICVHFKKASPDLNLIMNTWPDLPRELRLQIVKAVLEAIV